LTSPPWVRWFLVSAWLGAGAERRHEMKQIAFQGLGFEGEGSEDGLKPPPS
jgi:hypothetical protein